MLSRDRWNSLCERLQLEHTNEWFGKLASQYNEPHRAYHNSHHIADCLKQLNSAPSITSNVDAIELALWFHDVIYEMGANDNERRSARYFLDVTRGRLGNGRRWRAARHILATIYPSNPRDPDSRYVVDIDLSSFCLPWPQFLRDSANVRRESGHASDAEYARKQQQFLTQLAGSPPFFLSHYYLQHHEHQAQDNIRRILELLRTREQSAPELAEPGGA